MAGAAVTTWRRYAYSLAVWLDFLGVFGRCWDEATIGDVEAFKDWRLTDARNEGRVQASSFDADRAALNCFYEWASARYGVFNPVPTIRVRRTGPRQHGHVGGGSGFGGRDPLRPAGASRRQVKWLLRPAFEQWRNIGLRGYGFDGLRRTGWQGFNEDRDVAFVDGLYGTGLRLREWASILDVEIPVSESGRSARMWLSAACIKGGREGRVYRIPRRALAAVNACLDPVEGSRAEVIRRAQRSGRYDRLPGIRVVTGYNLPSRTLHIEGTASSELLSLDVVGPDERRKLFRTTPAGLEPLAVWLAPNGLPKKVHGWEDTFDHANTRVTRAWHVSDPNHGGDRARMPCPLWARPHMLRHSFCLKWFSVLSLVWEQKVKGFTTDELKDLREELGDIWYQLATLMGHASPSVTRDYYLEPFTGLQVDYLMSLLDEDEQTAVDALVRAVAEDSGRVVTGVAPSPPSGGIR
ncbi:site-specific integrase [Nocardia sp. CA-128927]|uniref:site-specific integrase n=1 Tax=Nocardia sp. CA-128927 TaxID=3239975 RepID=UPI003D97991D